MIKLEISDIVYKINSLASSVTELKESGSLTEEETKRKLIEPFFQCFGWDFTGYGSINVKMEYRTNNGSDNDRADYCFKIEDDSVFILEAKPLGTTFSEKERRQLRRYLQLDECKFGALTDGEYYEFYRRTDKDYKIFHRIHLSDEDSLQELDVQRIMWLDREIWDIWLVLNVQTFEELIPKFCDLEIKTEKDLIKDESPEQVLLSSDYTQRPPKGESITQKEYHEPIIEVLRENDGINGREVVREVGRKVSKKFTKWDTAKLRFGDIRWENRVWFALDDLKKEGKVKLVDHRYYLSK